MELFQVSKFLTADVVDRAFKLKTGSRDKIKSIKLTRAAPAGTGLLGAVYRIKVHGDSHFTSFVAKGMIQDALLRNSLAPAKYFEREIYFFTKVLPVLIDLQKSFGSKERLQNNVPICYAYHMDGENDYILMEDLSDSHCTEISESPNTTDRDEILKTLAHLHALSMALEQKMPAMFKNIVDNIPELYYTEENRNWYAAYLQNALKIDLKALAEFEDPKHSVYYKKFAELISDDPYGMLIRLVSNRCRRSVISHGDAWFPNFLRSKSRTVAIDFQLARCASPTIDVAYLVLLSSKQCANVKDAMEAFKVYHDYLSYYLNDVGIDADKVYSWKDMNTDLKTFGRFGALAVSTSIPLLCSDRCDVLGKFDEMNNGVEKIPLEELWPLTPFKTHEEKMFLLNAVRLAVDIELI